MNSDGYPEEHELEKIWEWPYTDPRGLMEYVEELWTYPDYWKQDGDKYTISTGGWSGNEDLIEAMEENIMFWLACWESSRRGGHFEFTVKEQSK